MPPSRATIDKGCTFSKNFIFYDGGSLAQNRREMDAVLILQYFFQVVYLGHGLHFFHLRK